MFSTKFQCNTKGSDWTCWNLFIVHIHLLYKFPDVCAITSVPDPYQFSLLPKGELEKLNQSTDDINRCETELEVSQTLENFRALPFICLSVLFSVGMWCIQGFSFSTHFLGNVLVTSSIKLTLFCLLRQVLSCSKAVQTQEFFSVKLQADLCPVMVFVSCQCWTVSTTHLYMQSRTL